MQSKRVPNTLPAPKPSPVLYLMEKSALPGPYQNEKVYQNGVARRASPGLPRAPTPAVHTWFMPLPPSRGSRLVRKFVFFYFSVKCSQTDIQ